MMSIVPRWKFTASYWQTSRIVTPVEPDLIYLFPVVEMRVVALR
jgi:hypothetical protein